MSKVPPRAMCFVAMPFGKKKPPGKKKPAVDFDKIYSFIERAVEEERMECVRADFEATGGFIHRPMYERLLVAEYVVADLTLANPNVTYEVGVRHGSQAKATLLVCAQEFVNLLPFDFKPLRVLTYRLNKNGKLRKSEGNKLRKALGKRLRQAVADELPADNPILQVTATDSSGPVQHEKTDVFLTRMRYASEIGNRVYKALNRKSTARTISELRAIEIEILTGTQVVAQLHTALISLYLGYREKKAYPQMVSLFKKLPPELQRTPVAVEQLALALNRLAEQSADKGKLDKAKRLRRKALHCLSELATQDWSSETYGIAGRIYKGQSETEQHANNPEKAKGAIELAVETYEKGFRLDPRDYYPGVNAVTLRLRSGTSADIEALNTLVPAVRFSVNRAPSPESEEEKYWQEATKLELACADNDWDTARTVLQKVLAIDVADWMRDTTIKNLQIQKQTFSANGTATGTLDEIIDLLKPDTVV